MGGYTGEPFAQAISAKLGASVQVAKRSDLPTFTVIPKLWVVESSFAWLEKCRRLWKNAINNPTLAYSSFPLPSLSSCFGDRKQVLRATVHTICKLLEII
jgi:transposase